MTPKALWWQISPRTTWPAPAFALFRETHTGNQQVLWATELAKSGSSWVCLSSLIARADFSFSYGWNIYKGFFEWTTSHITWLYFHYIWNSFISTRPRDTWHLRALCLTYLEKHTEFKGFNYLQYIKIFFFMFIPFILPKQETNK